MQLTTAADRTKCHLKTETIENFGTAVSNNSFFIAPAHSASQTINIKNLERKGSLPMVGVPKLDLRKLVSVDSIPQSCY